MDDPDLRPLSPSPETPPASAKSRWPFVVAATLTLLPGVFALTGNTGAAAAGAFLIAPLGALISGIVVGIHVGRTPGMRFLLSVALIVAFLAAAEGVAIGGCAISDPKFNFH